MTETQFTRLTDAFNAIEYEPGKTLSEVKTND